MRRHAAGLLALGITLVTIAHVQAANPRITLKVQNATAPEAAAQLGKAAGVSILVPTDDLPPQPAGNRDGGPPRFSFDWQDVPFSRALREVCGRYHLDPTPIPGGYQLAPGDAEPARKAPPRRVGLVQKNGFRLYATSVMISGNSRMVQFVDPDANGGPQAERGSLNIGVTAELPEGDAELIAGVANVVARDDMGHIMLAPEGESLTATGETSTWPDTWGGVINLDAPHPRAHKLAWVEGDLMGYKSVRKVHAEIPFGADKLLKQKVGDWLVAVSPAQKAQPPGTPEKDGDDEGLPKLTREGRGHQPESLVGVRVRIRVYQPQNSRYQFRESGWSYPLLMGQSGKVYAPFAAESSGGGANDSFSLNDTTMVFPKIPEPARFVWELVETQQPVRLFSFRMTDIPLPPPPAFVPRMSAPTKARTMEASVRRQFFERGGGTILSAVQLQEKHVSGGVLSIGLSLKQEADWSPVRWIDVDVQPDGTARLEDVKPGMYRVLRLYRPAQGAAAPPVTGHWTGSELQVPVLAKKPVSLAPLKWLPDREEKLAPVKPVPKKAPAR